MIGDEEIQALLNGSKLNMPEMLCPSGHLVERLCCESKCTFQAACCNEDDCKHCEERHHNCGLKKLRVVMKLIEEKMFFAKRAVADILRAESDLINELNATRKALIEEVREWKANEG
jgi:hypothetical protein